MVFEAVKVELTNGTGFPRLFNCASGTAITKGTLLKLTDPRTCIAQSAASDPIAGIASMDKANDDFSTTIAVWTDGIFEMTASGAIGVGEPVVADAALNAVKAAVLNNDLQTASGAAILGYALETAADAETINIRVRL